MLDCLKESCKFNTFQPGVDDGAADCSFSTSQMEQKRKITFSQLIPERTNGKSEESPQGDHHAIPVP